MAQSARGATKMVKKTVNNAPAKSNKGSAAATRQRKDDKLFAELEVSNTANDTAKKKKAAAAKLVAEQPVEEVEVVTAIEEPVTIEEVVLEEITELTEAVTATIEQGDPLTEPTQEVAEETEVTLAEIKPKKAGGKAVDPNSGRQAILRVIFENGNQPMSPAEINAQLKKQGREIKYISSHLNYFKSHGQVIHVENTSTYKLADKVLPRFEAEVTTNPTELTTA
jgi:hypothetical protein